MAQGRPSFFSVPALIILAVLLGIALYVLYPRQDLFSGSGNLDNPDALSLAYLEVLVRANPDDETLRVNLAKMQSSIGETASARATLWPLLQQETIPASAQAVDIDLSIRELAAAETEEERTTLSDALLSRLYQVTRQAYPAEQKIALITPALSWLQPRQAAAILEPLVAMTRGPEQIRLARQLATIQESAGRPDDAANTLTAILDRISPEEKTAFIDNLIRLELAAGHAPRALELFRQGHPRPQNPEPLRRGIELAQLAGDPVQERRWLAQLARIETDNLDLQRRLLQLQLGTGALASALATARQIQSLPGPLSQEDRTQIARVLEWNNRPEEALTYWQSLYASSSSPEALERSLDLARGLLRWQALSELLGQAASQGQLDAEGYGLLADTLIRQGQLEQAEQRLQQGLARFPRARSMRQRLVNLYINNLRYPDAIPLLASAPEPTDRDRLQLANLYWRTRNPEAALKALDFTPSDPDLLGEIAETRLNLAILLGRKDLLTREYNSLLAAPEEGLNAATRERLISLAVSFGDLPTALALSEARYRETGDSRHLMAMAEYQLALEQWDELEQTLDLWQASGTDPESMPRYWTIRARLDQYRNRPEAAEKAFARARTLMPGDSNTLVSWAWFLISRPERLPGELPALLQQIASNTGPDTYTVLAYGYSVLGQYPQALYWFRKGTEAGQDSVDWLSSWAQTLEDSGESARAFRIRQYLAAREGKPELARTPANSRSEPANSWSGPLYAFDNRALQAGVQWHNLGGFDVREATAKAQISHDDWRWLAQISAPEPDSSGRLLQPPAPATSGKFQLQNNHANTLWTATLGQADRLGSNDLVAALDLTTTPSDRWSLSAGHSRGERALDSAEAWWLTARDRTYLAARYNPLGSVDLNIRAETLNYTGPEQNTLARGFGLEAIASYRIFSNDPAWTVSLGYQKQSLDTLNALDATSTAALEPGITTEDLLARDYERIGIYNRWTHGEPHALYRTTPSPKFFVGFGAGYVVSSSTPDFGADAGLAWRLTGDDELAFSAGWTSDGLDGESRLNLNFTYTLYLGK